MTEDGGGLDIRRHRDLVKRICSANCGDSDRVKICISTWGCNQDRGEVKGQLEGGRGWVHCLVVVVSKDSEPVNSREAGWSDSRIFVSGDRIRRDEAKMQI